MTQVTVRRPVRRRPTFHALPIEALDRLTDDAVAVTFFVPPELREEFAFRAGQHVTLRVPVEDGTEARRTYSLCSTPDELESTGRLRIGVKEIPGGVFSAYVRQASVGDEVDVMPPMGRFTSDFDPSRTRRYVAVVAGSGITPVLSLAATALATEPASRFTILYGNRYARSVMFLEELADLKDRYPDRLQVVHVLSREPQDAELLSGRIDADRLPRLLDLFVPEPVDEWFLCGPYGMVVDAKKVLVDRGADPRTVHTELFHVSETPPPAPRERAAEEQTAGTGADADRTTVTVILDGRTSTVTMARHERVLDAALRVRSELPYSCRGGVCSTCRAKVTEGEVTMAANWALEPDEVAAGYVLTCQASPVTDRLTVDYDA